jgi:predicted RNA methylase
MFEIFFPIFLIALYFLVKLASRRNQTTVFGAPWVPLEPRVVNRIMELAKIKPGNKFYDLGSGDGRLVIAAASLGAKAYGIEIDLFRVWYSRFCILLFGLTGRAKIIHRNIFDVDLSSADIVTIYLLQETNDKLFIKLSRELRPNTRVVSAAFNFPKWKPIIVDPNGPIYGPLHLYHVQPKVKK